jgi:hypothetical protein
MNKDRLIELALSLDGHFLDLGFNMADHCQTIAGHALVMKHMEFFLSEEAINKVRNNTIENTFKEAAEWLDLDLDVAEKLFNPAVDATPQKAAKVILHLAETGDVDWTID